MVSEGFSRHVYIYVPRGLALTRRTDGAIRAATSKAFRKRMVGRNERKMAAAGGEEEDEEDEIAR